MFIRPVNAGESTLSVVRSDMRSSIARNTGWDRDPNNWEGDQIADGAAMLAAAERRVYGAHPWSFLEVSVAASMAANVPTYDLPDDFAAMEGPIVYTGIYCGYRPITHASAAVVWERRGVTGTTGVPAFYCCEPLPHSGKGIGQRYALQFDIAPACDFTVHCRYRISPYALSDTQTFPFGGQRFAEVFRYAALAQAEIEWKKIIDGPDDTHFRRLLAEAIAEDLRTGPKYLGQNLDSARAYHRRSRHDGAVGELLYNDEPITTS